MYIFFLFCSLILQKKYRYVNTRQIQIIIQLLFRKSPKQSLLLIYIVNQKNQKLHTIKLQTARTKMEPVLRLGVRERARTVTRSSVCPLMAEQCCRTSPRVSEQLLTISNTTCCIKQRRCNLFSASFHIINMTTKHYSRYYFIV